MYLATRRLRRLGSQVPWHWKRCDVPRATSCIAAVCSSPSDSQAASTAAWRASFIAPFAGSAAIVFQKSKVTARIGIGANLAGAGAGRGRDGPPAEPTTANCQSSFKEHSYAGMT